MKMKSCFGCKSRNTYSCHTREYEVEYISLREGYGLDMGLLNLVSPLYTPQNRKLAGLKLPCPKLHS